MKKPNKTNQSGQDKIKHQYFSIILRIKAALLAFLTPRFCLVIKIAIFF